MKRSSRCCRWAILLKTASLLQKVSTLDPKVLNSYEAIEMGTIKGAEALGLDSQIGSIEVGKKADIILIDTNCANMVPDSSSPSSNIIYSANGSNPVTSIFIMYRFFQDLILHTFYYSFNKTQTVFKFRENSIKLRFLFNYNKLGSAVFWCHRVFCNFWHRTT